MPPSATTVTRFGASRFIVAYMTSKAPRRVAAIVAKLSTCASSGRTHATGTPERETIADIFAVVRTLKSWSNFRSASAGRGTKFLRVARDAAPLYLALFHECSCNAGPQSRRDSRLKRRERDWIRDDSAVVQYAVEAVLLRGLLETTEDREVVAALLALVVLVEVPARDVEPVALDGDRAAARTICVLQGMAGHVPDVDVLEAFLLRDAAVLLEGLDGRPGELHHLVVRVEPQEVDRRVGAEVVVDPLRKFSGGREVVADLGDDEVRDLDVDLLRVPRVEERLEDRIRVRDVDVLPDEIRLAGSFEVDRHAVEELRHLRDRLRRVVAV